jgi:hypothetical protein
MGKGLHSFDRRIAQPRERPQDLALPSARLQIRARDADGEIRFDETLTVARQSSVARQREQLLRAVWHRFPDARLHRVSSAGALFIEGDWIVSANFTPGDR